MPAVFVSLPRMCCQASGLLAGPNINAARAAIVCVAWLASGAVSVGQQKTSDDIRSEQLKQVFQGVASGYSVTSSAGAELPLRDQPAMHWLSLESATGTYMGTVFVWTHMKRPEVIGTLFTSDVTKEELSICQELYSFSNEQLIVRSSKNNAWRPAPSEAMQVIPDAPVPAATEQGRRLQIRTMARRFSGRMNRRGVPHPLRLLPRPVYEYESDAPDILSGALLVLVAYTTDPDILLLIESRQTPEGPKWFFQPARFSDKSLWLAYRDKDVWTSLRNGHGTDKAHDPDHQYHVDFVTAAAPLERNGSTSKETP